MNSSVWAVLAAQGSKGKKVDLSFSEQLFVGKIFFYFFVKNIVASALKSYIKIYIYIFFLILGKIIMNF